MRKFYTSNNITISVAGNVEFTEIMGTLEKHFSHFKRSNKINDNPAHEVKPGIVCKSKRIEQVHICLATTGIKTNHEHRFECYLLNKILGGSMSSRLFQKIREERGLAYSVHSSHSNYYDTGAFIVYAATGIKNYNAVIELIVKELKDIKSNPISDKELNKAKNQLKGMLMLSLESSSSRMVQIAKEEMYFEKHFSLDEILKCIDNVTAEGIKNLAQNLFKSQFFNLALVGPIKENKVSEKILTC